MLLSWTNARTMKMMDNNFTSSEMVRNQPCKWKVTVNLDANSNSEMYTVTKSDSFYFVYFFLKYV